VVVGVAGQAIDVGVDRSDPAGGVVGELIAGERVRAPAAGRAGAVVVGQAQEPANVVVGLMRAGDVFGPGEIGIAIEARELAVGVVKEVEALLGDRVAAALRALLQARAALQVVVRGRVLEVSRAGDDRLQRRAAAVGVIGRLIHEQRREAGEGLRFVGDTAEIVVLKAVGGGDIGRLGELRSGVGFEEDRAHERGPVVPAFLGQVIQRIITPFDVPAQAVVESGLIVPFICIEAMRFWLPHLSPSAARNTSRKALDGSWKSFGALFTLQRTPWTLKENGAWP